MGQRKGGGIELELEGSCREGAVAKLLVVAPGGGGGGVVVGGAHADLGVHLVGYGTLKVHPCINEVVTFVDQVRWIETASN